MSPNQIDLIKKIKVALKIYKAEVKRPASGSLLYDYLVPAGVYEEMFDWDAFFVGMALSTNLSSEAIFLRNIALNFIHNSEKDGFTPGAFGPRGRDIEINHIKPFIAQTALFACRYLEDYDWIKTHYPRLKKMVLYREENLWSEKYDLGVWFDACESGVDNNITVLEYPNKTIIGTDCNTYIYREYKAMAYMASEIGSVSDAQFFNRRAAEIKNNINKYLWDEEDQSYYNLNTANDSFVKNMAFTNFIPLWEKLASEKQAHSMIKKYLINPEELWSSYGIRTLSKKDNGYNNVNMIKPFSNWQGPIWPLANYFCLHVLLNYGYQEQAIELAENTTNLVLIDIKKTGSMHENYDAETGAPLAAPNFVSWNLLINNMLDEAVHNKNPFKVDQEYKNPEDIFSLLNKKTVIELSNIFADEIEKKKNDKDSSLSLLMHPFHTNIPDKNHGVAFVANGMLGKSAKWKIVDDKITLHDIGLFTLPALTNKSEYFRLLTQKVSNDYSLESAGVNIAFALEPKSISGSIDGKLLRFAKEHYISGLKGRYVGKELELYLAENKNIKTRVAVANDIICLLFSGLNKGLNKTPMIAGIVGEGINFAFLDSSKQWLKNNTDKYPLVAVNLEAANFDKIPFTEATFAIDEISESPGKALAEKEASSNYLYLLYNWIMRQAYGHNADLISTSAKLNYIASEKGHIGYAIANSLLDRSAQIVALELVGIIIFLNKSEEVIPVIMDGDLFWNGYQYKDRVQKWIKTILPKVTIEFHKVENSDLIGAASIASISQFE